MNKILSVVGGVALIASSMVQAAGESGASSKSIVELLKAGGLKIEKTISVNQHLKGHLLVTEDGRKSIIFTDASNEVAIDLSSGRLINYDGTVLNQEIIDKLNPPKPFNEVKALIDQVDTIDAGANDPKKPTLYMLSESLCPACGSAHRGMAMLMHGNSVNIKIVPVSFHDGAREVWGKIYESDNRLEALEQTFDELMAGRQPQMSVSMPSKVIQTLDKANQVMEDLRAQTTPTFFYEKNGRLVKFSGADPVSINQAVIDLLSS